MRSFIEEARRNPDKNPRSPSFQQILDKGYYHKDYFLSFTSINKVGINPSSSYNTPNGIYAYPVVEIMNTVRGDLTNVPYAQNAPYIQVIKKKGSGIVDPIESYTNAQYKKDYAAIFDMIVNNKKKSLPMNGFGRELVQQAMQRGEKGAKENTPFAKFWNVTREISADPDIAGFMGWGGTKESSFRDYYDPKDHVVRTKEGKLKRKDRNERKGIRKQKKSLGSNSQGWNNLLRMLGYNAFIDRSGSGMLHENEPISSVFLTTKAFKHVDTINNNSYKRLVRQGRYEQEIKLLQNNRKNEVNVTGKISGDSEKAFHQIVDSDLEGCNIDFFKDKFFISGIGGSVSKGNFNSKLIEFDSISIYGGSFTNMDTAFKKCVIHAGEFTQVEFNDTEIVGGNFIDCMFNNIDVISNGDFLKCRFMARMVIFKSTFSDCNIQECGLSVCKIYGGYLSGGILDSGIRVRGGTRIDQVSINGGRYTKVFIERSSIKGGVFNGCRLIDTDVKAGEFNNVTRDGGTVTGGEWSEDL